MRDLLRYDKMVEAALRSVVREVLARTASGGLPGAHHFYITYRTRFPGVELPDYLATQYPSEMTIVLEHQFWDLEVGEDGFSVTLTFQNQPERLVVPFEAITAFADPSVKFGLQFQENAEEEKGPAAVPVALPSSPGADKGGEAPVADTRPFADTGKGADSKTADAKEGGTKAGPAKPAEVVALDAFRKK